MTDPADIAGLCENIRQCCNNLCDDLSLEEFHANLDSIRRSATALAASTARVAELEGALGIIAEDDDDPETGKHTREVFRTGAMRFDVIKVRREPKP